LGKSDSAILGWLHHHESYCIQYDDMMPMQKSVSCHGIVLHLNVVLSIFDFQILHCADEVLCCHHVLFLLYFHIVHTSDPLWCANPSMNALMNENITVGSSYNSFTQAFVSNYVLDTYYFGGGCFLPSPGLPRLVCFAFVLFCFAFLLFMLFSMYVAVQQL
jgi:hypothetical protein